MVHVGIVGVGLIGGSLGMALRRHRRNGRRIYHVSGWARSAAALRRAQRLGAIDRGSTSPKEALATADVIVFCVPVDLMSEVARRILPILKRGALLTDVGSVKDAVRKELTSVTRRRPDLRFVGAHPLAGSEKAGVQNGHADLFHNATCVIVTEGARLNDVRTIRRMWQAAGAQSLLLKAHQHDRLVALTSHLPHLLAFSLFDVIRRESARSPLIRRLVATSFRDMTRIAGSDPNLWSGILKMNLPHLRVAEKEFHRSMASLLRAPSSQRRSLLRRLTHTKKTWDRNLN